MKNKLNKKFDFDGKQTTASVTLKNPVHTELSSCCTTTKIIAALLTKPEVLTFTAKSFPDERDEYSENFGIDVAGMKADRKYHSYMAKRYSSMVAILEKAIEELTRLSNYHQKKINNIDDDMSRFYFKEN